MKAMIVNRVGDVGLALAMFVCYNVFHSLDFSVIFPLCHAYSGYNLVFLGYEVHALTLISILLFVGAVGKSAQLGLHT
jgi:NADH-quinone oxidoreductase subunit L